MTQHYDAARSSLRSGDQEAAASEYKAFLAVAIHRAANARARGGDFSGALRSFDEALIFSGDDPTIRLDYASVLFDQGRLQEAEGPAQWAVAVDPKNARSQMLLGRILFEKKNYADASVHLQAASDSGQFLQVWRTLAITYLRLQQLDRAGNVLRNMIATLGDSAQNQVAAATVYYYGDYPDQAAAELKRVIAQHPDAVDAHYYLGLTYLARNENAGYAKAVPEFQAELALAPDDFRSRYMLGYVALQQRHFAEAERELLRARSLNSRDPGTQLLLGQLYSETDHARQAEDVLRGLIASWSENHPADFRLVRAHYILGRLLRESGKLEEGSTETKTAEELRKQLRGSEAEPPRSRVESRSNAEFASAGGSSDKNPRAPNLAEQAQAQAFIAQISPLIGEAYYNLGSIAAQHKDPSLAARYLQKAGEWDPSLAKLQH
jgi:tetratricopeptide (TPR) repeat protein